LAHYEAIEGQLLIVVSGEVSSSINHSLHYQQYFFLAMCIPSQNVNTKAYNKVLLNQQKKKLFSVCDNKRVSGLLVYADILLIFKNKVNFITEHMI